MIQSLTVRDATGALGAAAGTEAGMVLTPWNPDESWTHDALVQVSNSIHAILLDILGLAIHSALKTKVWYLRCFVRDCQCEESTQMADVRE